MANKRFVLALDQGTTSSRAMIVDQVGRVHSIAQREFPQIFPNPGWVEHDAIEIWSSQIGSATEALAGANLSSQDIAAIGITNQRETTLLWNRKTGVPIYNAIVWQDRRTADFCDALIRDGHAEMIADKTGLQPDAYFSGSKIRWLLDNVAGARASAVRGDLAFGTMDSWLIWKLTNGKRHITDVTNASRTLLFNLHTLQWDDELLQLLDIPRSLLPEVVPSSGICATTEGLLDDIPIAGIAGDQQAALFGQRCITPGLTKNTYGTGCFMLQSTGTRPLRSKNRLLTTVAWRIGDTTHYALEGSIFVGGAVVQWPRDGLGIIRRSAEVEALASSVPDNGGVYFVPAFVGLGAPHWDPHARGAIVGLTRGSPAGHIARAALESIVYQVADLMDAVQTDTGTPLVELRVDGGASANDALMQFQADVLGVPVVRPSMTETTALGAAYLAGLGSGLWKQTRTIAELQREERRFEPHMPRALVNELRERWNEAISRSRGWNVS